MNPLRRIFSYLLIVGGLLFILAAFFARLLRLDNNDHWGLGRYLLVAVGLGLWLVWAWLTSRPLRLKLAEKLRGVFLRVEMLPGVKWIQNRYYSIKEAWGQSTPRRLIKRCWTGFISLPGVRWIAASPNRQAGFWAGTGLLLTLFIYTWLATAGTMTHLIPSSGFIDMQGSAFLKGQLSLVETPPADLLALKNPYDLSQRLKLKYIWDASLYQGKYYLYWGPVPALAEAAYRGATGRGLGDEFFGFVLLCLLAAIQTLWLVDLRKTYFPRSAPPWLLFFVLAVTLISPITFNISWLSVYVVSTLSAQVFLLGGLFFVRCAFSDEPAAAWRWILFGLCLGLAASARINMLLVIAWMGLLLAGKSLAVPHKKGFETFKPLFLTAVPLALVLIGIMTYNQVRFNSPFEFGSRYQLTVTDINHFYSSVVSADYIKPNLYVYLLRPFVFRVEFPFIYSQWVTGDTFPSFIILPPGYLSTDPVDGLLMTSPFILFAILPLWRRVGGLLQLAKAREWKILFLDLFSKEIILLMFYGMGLIAFGFILTFYYPTMRYLIDSIPSLALMAAVGGWQWTNSGRMKGFKSTILGLLILATIMVGFLLCINGPHDYFEQANPALFYHLIGFFKGQ